MISAVADHLSQYLTRNLTIQFPMDGLSGWRDKQSGADFTLPIKQLMCGLGCKVGAIIRSRFYGNPLVLLAARQARYLAVGPI